MFLLLWWDHDVNGYLLLDVVADRYVLVGRVVIVLLERIWIRIYHLHLIVVIIGIPILLRSVSLVSLVSLVSPVILIILRVCIIWVFLSIINIQVVVLVRVLACLLVIYHW